MRLRKAVVAAAGVAVLALSACGSSRPVSGTVTAKNYSPTHEGEVWTVLYYSPRIQTREECELIGKTDECEPQTYTQMVPQYGYEPEQIPAAWSLKVRDVKGKLHTVGVSQNVYDAESIGAYYNSKRAS